MGTLLRTVLRGHELGFSGCEQHEVWEWLPLETCTEWREKSRVTPIKKWSTIVVLVKFCPAKSHAFPTFSAVDKVNTQNREYSYILHSSTSTAFRTIQTILRQLSLKTTSPTYSIISNQPKAFGLNRHTVQASLCLSLARTDRTQALKLLHQLKRHSTHVGGTPTHRVTHGNPVYTIQGHAYWSE